MSEKLNYFIPPKPVSDPFGAGSGTALQFYVGRDGVLDIEMTDVGAVIITMEKPNGQRRRFVQPPGGGYGGIVREEAKEDPKGKGERR